MGVWIEIKKVGADEIISKSLPLWECGLKSFPYQRTPTTNSVTPLVGVWIEICNIEDIGTSNYVTPLVGVWIEICKIVYIGSSNYVSPLVGVWIEISTHL